MGRASSIDRLPRPIRDRIGQLLGEHVTLDAILNALKPLGADAATISRSALGRYAQKIAVVGERIRRSREIAEAVTRPLGEGHESRLMEANLELLESGIFDITGGAEDERPVTLDPNQAAQISMAVRNIAIARRHDAEFIVKVQRKLIADQKAKLEKLEDKAGIGKRGLDVETLRRVREEIYGIPPEQAAAP
jgi:hypothetical protein